MLKKTITYVDYDGVERTEDFYFNLTKAEITEMQLSAEGGLKAQLEQIVATKDVPRMIKMWKGILLKAYGQKSLDGKRFIKTEQLTEEFTQTEAYSQLFMELATDDKAAAAFIKGVIPSDVAEQVENQKKNIPAPPIR